MIANPPQELPSNWTYRCLGIPVVQSDTSYFAYPDDSPCSCDNGCYNYTDDSPADPIFYDDEEVKDWNVSSVSTNPNKNITVDHINVRYILLFKNS